MWNRDHLLFAGSLILTLFIGFCLGGLWKSNTTQHSALQLVPDARELIPVVTISDISDGALHGKSLGTVRVFGGTTMATTESGAFSIPLSQLHRMLTITIPEGMTYVASKTGKIAYPVLSPSGSRIAPERRRYFRTAEEARAAGFRAK